MTTATLFNYTYSPTTGRNPHAGAAAACAALSSSAAARRAG